VFSALESVSYREQQGRVLVFSCSTLTYKSESTEVHRGNDVVSQCLRLVLQYKYRNRIQLLEEQNNIKTCIEYLDICTGKQAKNTEKEQHFCSVDADQLV